MKIVIDARTLYWTGVGRYAKALLDQLQELDTTNQYYVLMRKQDWPLWKPKKPNFTRVESSINPYSFGEQTRLAVQLYRLKPDVVHFLSFNAPLAYLGAHVTTVHDLTLVDYKNLRGGGLKALAYDAKYWVMRAGMRIITRTSGSLITPTEYTKKELVARGYAKQDKITAIHHGAPRLHDTTKKVVASAQTLLYVGNLYPFKNLAMVVEALPILKQHHPGLRFIVVGQEDVFGADLTKLADKLGVADKLELTGFISDEQLAAHYQAASLYVFPSLSEGFGLPPLEAMGHGLPVAAANTSCLPEVLGSAAAYFDPHDPSDIARVIGEILDSPAKREQMKKDGLVHITNFSWERMAKQTLAVYSNTLKNNRRRPSLRP